MAFRTRQFDARRGRLRSSESLAGWIFADMLLVLFIVGIGAAMAYKAPPPEPEIEEKQAITGMEVEPLEHTLKVNSERLIAKDEEENRRVCDVIQAKFQSEIDNRDMAAFVMIFAGGSQDEISKAINVSERVRDQLRCADPDLFSRETVKRGRYSWHGKLKDPDNVRIEVWLYTRESSDG